ncbi:minor capsid protein [Listeria monocytogenes]|nr:minor capsid protein [Listeria monocytogenes]
MAHDHNSAVDFETDAGVLRDHFNASEVALLLLIKKHVMHGVNNPTTWKHVQQNRLSKFKRELRAFISRFKSDSKDRIDKLVLQVYLACVTEYEEEMQESKGVKKNVSKPEDDYRNEKESLYAITDQIASNWQTRATTGYQDTVNKTDPSKGVLKYIAATSLINVFGDGIKGFLDDSGRKWKASAYVEMASRGAFFHVGLNAMRRVLGAYDHDLVQVSAHERSCPKCAPWQGQVLSVSGSSQIYTSLDEAEGAGLFHPNCHHFLSSYEDGEETDEPIPYDEEEYEAQQKQRYYERGIRDWKKKDVLAEGPVKQYTNGKVKQWENALKDHLNDNPFLEREKNRETVSA